MIETINSALKLCVTDAVKLMKEEDADECKYKIGEADGLKFSLYIEPTEQQGASGIREIVVFDDFTYNCVSEI